MILQDKVIVVVGAGGLLGQEIVRAVEKEGGLVVAADVNRQSVEELASSLSPERVVAAKADISDQESIRQLLNTAESKWGSVDGAVNTAYPRNKNYGRKLFDVTYEDFCENLGLHLGGYFLFMQQCAVYARDAGRPFSLVNMSSIYGTIAPKFDVYEGTNMTMPVEYAAIKSALQHITRYFASTMKGTRFRVNCVSPGGILSGQDHVFLENYSKYCGSKGMLTEIDVVGSVIFMLSDLSRYVCGQNIIVDDSFSV